jgi:hypothetical protein
MTTIFNAEALVAVEVVGKRLDHTASYQQRQKHRWLWVIPLPETKPGFYFHYGTALMQVGPFTKEELEKGNEGDGGKVRPFVDAYRPKYLVEGEAVYYRPYVRLSFAGGKSTIVHFNTEADALAWGKQKAMLGIRVQIITRL